MTSLRRSVDQEFEDEDLAKHERTGRSCDRLRMALKECIKQSHCVQVDRRSARECIDAHDGTIPDRCFTLTTIFSDCKRSLVDMRSRFRGRKGDL